MSQESADLRRLAAIVFTDFVGYSALTQRNEGIALSLLSEHNRIIRVALPAHRGKEIKTVGDAFLVEFASALDAVRCAIAIQHALHDRHAVAGDAAIHVRIGIHPGDVVYRDGDVFGDGVNIAFRRTWPDRCKTSSTRRCITSDEANWAAVEWPRLAGSRLTVNSGAWVILASAPNPHR